MEPLVAPTPWHQSLKVVIAAAILLPPVGLVLLWLRGDTETGKKIFGSLGILALGAAYFFLFSGGVLVGQSDPASEAHYAELERQRATQREAASPSVVLPPQTRVPSRRQPRTLTNR